MSSSRLGGEDRVGMYEEGDDDEVFGATSSVSGGESDEEEEGEDQFSEGGASAAAGNQMEHRAFAPAPLRRMNSDSIYDLSSMTAQLPAKKGLSRYYEGKSQSFACMSEVRSLEDLRKKEKPYKQKIKPCNSYAALGGIAKTQSSSSCANLSMMGPSGGFRAPPIPVSKNGYHQ
uniref:Oxidative stress 3 n=1 Tax=Leersia perrieri TaxID=77586 RepID=A0A0D9WIU4_9ORYZ